jgi:AhpD family alkylhydroperoxidase
MVVVMDFRKRTYRNPLELVADLFFPVRKIKRLRKIKNKRLISPSFQERLMLAVTSVEGCRYCSFFHSKLALQDGISQEEVESLLSGNFDDCPEDEVMAIFYAQHWAESNANPDPEATRKLREIYDPEKVEAIYLILRMIRMGNLMGNTWDYFLHRISFGKWGR